MVEIIKTIKIILFPVLGKICVDEPYSKPYKTYFDKDAVDKCLSDMINNSKHCGRVIEKEFNRPLLLAKKKFEYF